MFTGIVRELGSIEGIYSSGDGATLAVGATFAGDLNRGDSVAVNGVCLTVTEKSETGFSADVMNQTLGLTGLGSLQAGDRANLEPALRAGDPMGGHIVQGHVDCVGEVESVTDDGIAQRFRVAIPREHHRYVVEHGSVTVDGVSLTVAALTDEGFEVSVIPETRERTTFGSRVAGDRVNVELDVIARYVERLLQNGRADD